MTVILVLITFAAFIMIDALLNWKKSAVPQGVLVPGEPSTLRRLISGFELPENLRYHAGHTWLVKERKNVNRVGADQFAAALLAGAESVELPKPGTWIRQGQKVFSFMKNGERVDMVSPVEGEVVEVNQELVKNPGLLREDPYGAAWMVAVFSPDEDAPGRNLLPVNLVSTWMREAAERLYAFQPALAGATSADGGEPVDDIHAAVQHVPFAKIGKEFFLS